MNGTGALSRAYAVIEHNPAIVKPTPRTSGYQPIDLVLLDTAGWRGLAFAMGWSQEYRWSIDDLANRWLGGSDRRDVLALANRAAAARNNPVFAGLVVSWLDVDRMNRLMSLAEQLNPSDPVPPWCYSVTKAFTAVDVAIEHVRSRPHLTDDQLRISSFPVPPLPDE